MTGPCDELLEHLEDAVAGELPAHLAEHVQGCSGCQATIERTLGLAAPGALLAGVRASRELVSRLKAIGRVAPACTRAAELMSAVLDGEADEAERSVLVGHLHSCPRCQAAWEAFATLREVGARVRAPRRLRAALALPPGQRIVLRRRRPAFDLRLATAAAYLLAAATIVLVSNPATLARASSTTVDRAGVYARAAVENRLAAYSRRVRETIAIAADWAGERSSNALARARALLGLGENRKSDKPVEKGGQGGKQP